jgi:hypothetical protein
MRGLPAVVFPAIAFLCLWSAAGNTQSYPIADRIAQKVIEKYQNSSCQQLQSERTQPPSGMKAEEMQRAVTIMRNDPQLRAHFLNMIAGPIANKLFECGMIP